MKIGDNIRRLRRERGLTQETLAEFLGVTFQSVSKWERGESCPDISMLPAIATFFGVTTDELLDVNGEERKAKVKAYIDEYNDLRMKNSPYVFEQISKAVKEFPGDYDLLVRYLEMLIYEKSGADSDSEKIIDKVESIYDRILRFRTCRVIFSRHSQTLLYLSSDNVLHFELYGYLYGLLSAQAYRERRNCIRSL